MIGIFDSGSGGLSALFTLRQLFPQSNFCYLGDTANLPYGKKQDAEICRLARRAASFFAQRRASALLCACGTVSCIAKEALSDLPFPVYGVAEAAAFAAIKASPTGKIGLIATEAAVRSGYYQRIIAQSSPKAQITALPCSCLVPPAEYGAKRSERLTKEIWDLLSPLRQAGCDTVILGCTHFFLLKNEISQALPGVALIDSGRAGALALALAHPPEAEEGKIECFVTQDPAAFDKRARPLLKESYPGAKLLHLPE